MQTHIAKRKERRCDQCGRKIPIGARYFYDNGGSEHTNCLEYEDQPLLEAGFNHNRKLGEVKSVMPDQVDDFGHLKEK